MIFRKARGKITIEDLIETMQSRDFLWSFEGLPFVWQFMPRESRYDDWGVDDEPKGDTVALSFADDDTPCPVCGETHYWQYCPECGHKLTFKEEDAT